MKVRGIVFSLVFAVFLGTGGCKEKTAQEKREAAQTEFRRQVLKKDPLDVVRAVGRPKEKWRRDTHNFFYKYVIEKDPGTGKALTATVVFHDRQAESVRFKQVQLASVE